eukprot:TRINITY_DN4270_c0_g1_i11.p1 TRINITY_DN4270_c0_g1~~TRINITY_DN4270_c0_g1_i11.p1  ORF type:complete len:385 (-),score=85.89 TRINITY_DN4270_c0_g1_i11:167-1321(-)
MTMREFRALRLAVGKPRRFSDKVIAEEREKLNNFRRIVRIFLSEKNPRVLQDIPQQMIPEVLKLTPLSVGQLVLAIHPLCKHFHRGSIMTIEPSSVMLKFFGNDLGVHKVEDTNLFILNETAGTSSTQKDGMDKNKGSVEKLANQQSITQDVDLYSMAFLIKVLERKHALVNEIRNFNDLAEKNPHNLNEKFLQEYGWTGLHINLLDNALKHIIAKFRLRGLHSFNLQATSQNFDIVLNNPLRDFIDREIDSAKDQASQDTLRELKNIMDKSLEEKISLQVHELITMKEKSIMAERTAIVADEKQDGGTNVQESETNQQHTAYLRSLIENCLGVLITVRQNGELSLNDNKFLRELGDKIYEDHQDEFYEINNILLHLNNKTNRT